MNRPSVRQIVGIFVILLLCLGGGAAFIWFKIAGLKRDVQTGLENTLGAKVEIASLNIDPWNERIEASGISLTNRRPDAPWSQGEIGHAVATFKWRDLFGPTIPLSVEVSLWKVALHSASSGWVFPTPQVSTAAEADSSASRNAIQVTQISAHDGEVEINLGGDKKLLIHQVVFEANENATEAWTTNLKTGSVDAGTIQAGPGSVQIQGDRARIIFSDLHLQCDQGGIEGDGQISLVSDHSTQASLKASKVPVAMLIATQWQTKLSGLASGTLDYQGNDQGALAHGHIDVDHGRFNILPLSSKVTALVSLPDFTGVDLDKATADFDWKDSSLHLTNLDLRKIDLARICGDMQIDAAGQVDGKLKLGLPSTVTAKWPNLQDKVFSVSLENYNWAEFHVTGTPDHLEEDLTPRLVAAGVIDGRSLLNSATQGAVDLLNSVLKNN